MFFMCKQKYKTKNNCVHLLCRKWNFNLGIFFLSMFIVANYNKMSARRISKGGHANSLCLSANCQYENCQSANCKSANSGVHSAIENPEISEMCQSVKCPWCLRPQIANLQICKDLNRSSFLSNLVS
jgi:hypothetical protein